MSGLRCVEFEASPQAPLPTGCRRYNILVGTNTDMHRQSDAAARELEELRVSHANLHKRIRDTALVSTSNTQVRWG